MASSPAVPKGAVITPAQAGGWGTIIPQSIASGNQLTIQLSQFGVNTIQIVAAPCSGIYVGGSGNLHIADQNGLDVIMVGVVAGSFLPIRPYYVYSDNTTATDLVAVY